MKKKNFNFNEVIYEEKLDNGLKIYLYPTNKTNNFYITVSTHFGAEVLKYKKDDKVYDVTRGSAHFLEHRVMDFTKNKEAMDKINEYGTLVNAYTTYNGTNYNLFGNEKIIENMTLLFDAVFKAKIKKEDVENERGIITEELYMYLADPDYMLQCFSNKFSFNKSFIRYPIIGNYDGINGVTCEELNRLYKDFYTLDNMFIVVTGKFDKDEVLEFIKKYVSKLKSSKSNIKVIRPRESLKCPVEYQERTLSLNEPKVMVAYKMPFSKKNIDKYKIIIGMLIHNTFGSSGDGFLELKNKGVNDFANYTEKIDNILVLYFKGNTNNTKEFTDIIDKYVRSINLDSESLDRMKKVLLSSLILTFEDFVNVEEMITCSEFADHKLNNNKDKLVNSITLSDVKDVVNSLNFDNRSVTILKSE